MKEVLYNYLSNDDTSLLSRSLYESIHEMLSCIIKYGFKKSSNKIDVILYNENKKHTMIIDTLYVNPNFILNSECRKITCNLKNDVHCLREFNVFYDPGYSGGHTDYLMELSIKKLFNQCTRSENITQNIEKKTPPKKDKETVKDLSSDISDALKNISELSKNINTVPTIDTVIFPDELFQDKSETESNSNDSIFEDDNPRVDIKKKIKDSNDISVEDDIDNLNNIADNEIKKLEELKKSADDTLKNLKKVTESEGNNLSRFACVVRDAEQEINKDNERDKRDYDIFVSEKEYTYPKIYHHFFVKKIIKSWDHIPILFMTKFAVYLYLDGRDINGETIRQKILGTPDEFRIFIMLYDSITDDEFDMPDDPKDITLINDFINNLPPIVLVSTEDIMDTLNDDDNKNTELFKSDGTDQCSESEDEDDKIDSYAPPKIKTN